MKKLAFLGSSLGDIRDFPPEVRREAGFQLSLVQQGEDPDDWKPMTTIGSGVREIRIRATNQYRVIYIAKFEEAIYVLHAFEKKTQQTSKQDIDLARQRLKSIQR